MAGVEMRSHFADVSGIVTLESFLEIFYGCPVTEALLRCATNRVLFLGSKELAGNFKTAGGRLCLLCNLECTVPNLLPLNEYKKVCIS